MSRTPTYADEVTDARGATGRTPGRNRWMSRGSPVQVPRGASGLEYLVLLVLTGGTSYYGTSSAATEVASLRTEIAGYQRRVDERMNRLELLFEIEHLKKSTTAESP